MSLKDEVEFVKESISKDEKMLESAFRFEKIYKKHKTKIWIVVIALLLWVAFSQYMSYQKQQNINASNEALSALEKSADDKEALNKLKDVNPKLYDLYSYSVAVKNEDTSTLEKLSSSNDEIVADLSKYHLGVLSGDPQDSKYYSDLSTLQAAYAAIRKKDYDTAKERLTEIDDKSPVMPIVNKLKHLLIGK